MSDPGIGTERDTGLHFDLVALFELKQHVGDELVPVYEPVCRRIQLKKNYDFFVIFENTSPFVGLFSPVFYRPRT